MMLDVPDILRQTGRRVVPEAALLRDDGWFQPPAATDGSPSPYSPLTPPEAADASRKVREPWGESVKAFEIVYANLERSRSHL